MDAETTPVIIGVGEIRDRPQDPEQALDPMGLMAVALGRAGADAAGGNASEADGGGLLARIDSIDLVHQTSWAYADTARTLCARVGIAPRRAEYGVTGGESPVRYIHQAAMRIAAGESRMAAVTGAEAQYARAQAKKAGITLPWPPRADTVENRLDPRDLYHPLAVAHGVMAPADIYPLYENAAAPAWDQSPGEALAESAALWAGYSAVAATNPYGWADRALDARTIATPGPDNRMIAWPYTKSMVANPQVNQGAAVIIASLAEARRAGVAEDRMVFLRGGARANEPRDYLARDRYDRSTAQDAVLARTAALAGRIDAVELYSCFPIVPKMARRTLGLDVTDEMTVTGGLSFFGAPLNNYMTQAACAMVRALRQGPATTGLLYGQGEFVTKHHALMLAREPGAEPICLIDAQAEADTARGPVPPLAPEYAGPALLESFTIPYDREGRPRFAMVLALTPDGRRTVARMDAQDTQALTSLTTSPVGGAGVVTAGELARWTFA
ncbi:MAG: acetyl-CoA acetyltransferase [Sphingobium sp.]